jgi:hypothetical protein
VTQVFHDARPDGVYRIVEGDDTLAPVAVTPIGF